MVAITSFWSSRVIDWGAAAARFVFQSNSAKARALIRLHMGLASRFLVGSFWRVRPGCHGEVPAARLRDQLSSAQLEVLFGDADGDAEMGGLGREDGGVRLGGPHTEPGETTGELRIAGLGHDDIDHALRGVATAGNLAAAHSREEVGQPLLGGSAVLDGEQAGEARSGRLAI